MEKNKFRCERHDIYEFNPPPFEEFKGEYDFFAEGHKSYKIENYNNGIAITTRQTIPQALNPYDGMMEFVEITARVVYGDLEFDNNEKGYEEACQEAQQIFLRSEKNDNRNIRKS